MDEEMDEITGEYLVRANDLIRQTGPPKPFLVETVLPNRKLAILSAASEAGKSFLALDLMDCIATERAFDGQKEKHNDR